jgi:hypothetical protein
MLKKKLPNGLIEPKGERDRSDDDCKQPNAGIVAVHK